MKKLVAFSAGALAAGSMALITAGHASSTGPLDVSGQTYGQAAALLSKQGYMPVFGGSVGSDVQQSQCIVQSQKMLPNGRVSLMLNCTKAAQPAPGSNVAPGQPGPPKVGSNGVTTVTPTPVGPQPGMNIPGT
ncbi:MAG: hypothetical protein JWR32_595 [Mycobacterium sp.]|nr:hypothetical protein [Mycobacterium sp.]